MDIFDERKEEVASILQNFVIIVQSQFGRNVKIIHSDNCLEFKLGPMSQFYSQKGIIHQISYVDTPQQNGRVGGDIGTY